MFGIVVAVAVQSAFNLKIFKNIFFIFYFLFLRLVHQNNLKKQFKNIKDIFFKKNFNFKKT
jgi:nitrate reductase gamma subunit